MQMDDFRGCQETRCSIRASCMLWSSYLQAAGLRPPTDGAVFNSHPVASAARTEPFLEINCAAVWPQSDWFNWSALVGVESVDARRSSGICWMHVQKTVCPFSIGGSNYPKRLKTTRVVTLMLISRIFQLLEALTISIQVLEKDEAFIICRCTASNAKVIRPYLYMNSLLSVVI